MTARWFADDARVHAQDDARDMTPTEKRRAIYPGGSFMYSPDLTKNPEPGSEADAAMIFAALQDDEPDIGQIEPYWNEILSTSRPISNRFTGDWSEYRKSAPVTPIHGRRSTYVAPDAPKHTEWGVWFVVGCLAVVSVLGIALLAAEAVRRLVAL